MISPREESATLSEREHARVSGKDSAPDPLEQLLSRVGDDVGKLVETVRRITFAELQRMHLKAVDGFFRGALYLCLLSGGVALTICAVLYVAAGVRGAAVAGTGTEWGGSLVTGSAILVLVWFAGLGLRRLLREHLVRSVERDARFGSFRRAAGKRPGGRQVKSPSERLEACRREEWRRLNRDVDRLARDASETAHAFVSRHPLAALASSAALGMYASSTVRSRPGPVDSRPKKRRSLIATLGSLLRTSLNGGLATVLQDTMRPQRREASSPRSSPN